MQLKWFRKETIIEIICIIIIITIGMIITVKIINKKLLGAG